MGTSSGVYELKPSAQERVF